MAIPCPTVISMALSNVPLPSTSNFSNNSVIPHVSATKIGQKKGHVPKYSKCIGLYLPSIWSMPVVNVGKNIYTYRYTTPIRLVSLVWCWLTYRLTSLYLYQNIPLFPTLREDPHGFFSKKLATCRNIRTFVSFFAKPKGFSATKVHFWWMISKKLKKGQRFVFLPNSCTKRTHLTVENHHLTSLNVPISGSKFTFPVAVGHTVDGRNPAPGLSAWIRPW